MHVPSTSKKLLKGSPRSAHTSPATGGKVVKVASKSIHAKHNKGVAQPFIAKGL